MLRIIIFDELTDILIKFNFKFSYFNVPLLKKYLFKVFINNGYFPVKTNFLDDKTMLNIKLILCINFY